MSKDVYDSDITADGEQTLVPGVTPLTPRDRLEAQMSAPMQPRCRQKPCDLGLFDAAVTRNQLELF